MGHGVGHHIDISIHALREEGDAGVFSQIVDLGVFLSTPSVRRATTALRSLRLTARYFYPRPPRGGRHGNGTTTGTIKLFLSTPSVRRAT